METRSGLPGLKGHLSCTAGEALLLQQSGVIRSNLACQDTPPVM